MRKVLNVAEKPSMSRKITEVLSRKHFSVRDGRNKYCKNYDFSGEIFAHQEAVQMTMTCVLGHLSGIDFPPEYANWRATDPIFLFEAPTATKVADANRSILQNLTVEARSAQVLVIWTDCDREGEQIGHEISVVCAEANSKITVYRARYSTVTEKELRKACRELAPLNMNQVAAVQLRMELDLRTGASLTRFLSLLLAESSAAHASNALRREDGSSASAFKVISYGSCQFPTLGFVVEQFLKRERFRSEPFYFLSLVLAKNSTKIQTNWRRCKLFDKVVTLLLFRRAIESATAAKGAVVISFEAKPTSKMRPLPLTTIELQKFATSYFKMSSAKVMKVAEELYNSGLISYPRTETDIFPKGFAFGDVVRLQTPHPEWGPAAQTLLQRTGGNGESIGARRGKKDDGAHPPIHPTGLDESLSGDAKKIYEFVVRRFLAVCSDDAKGFEKVAEFAAGSEIFCARGLSVTERNFLDVYPYEKWHSNQIPDFFVGECVAIESLRMEGGSTTAPLLLSESQLIATMDKNGIGTDATIHDHIQKIIDRAYAVKRRDHRFEPTGVGLALITSHDAILDNIEVCVTKPRLRALLESALKLVEVGSQRKEPVLAKFIGLFRHIYGLLTARKEVIVSFFGRHGAASLQSPQNSTASLRPNPVSGQSGSSRRSSSSSVSAADRSSSNGSAAGSVRCFCDLQAKTFASKTANSAGRRFASCPKAYERCKFFQWLDD